VLRFDTTTNALGVTAMTQAPDGRIFLSVKEPDSVLILDPGGRDDLADRRFDPRVRLHRLLEWRGRLAASLERRNDRALRARLRQCLGRRGGLTVT
jgi:hypothetical protein